MIPEKSIKTARNEMTYSMEDDPYEVEKCAKWIDSTNINKICLQFPDNLLSCSVQVAMQLESCINKKVYILGDTTCGSCCVDEIAAQHINADGLIHFGHACLNPTIRLPVFHVLPKKDIDVTDLLNKFQSTFQDYDKKILFFYDVAYAHKIESICKMLSSIFKNIIFSKLNCTSNVEFADVKESSSSMIILGRSFTLEENCKVDDYEAFFLGGTGKTLSILSMSISAKTWYYFDNNNNNIIQFEPMNSPWLKRRRFLIEKLRESKVVGIVVATLGIKEYLRSIVMVKNTLKQKNKKSYILCVGKINPAKLANFPEIDAFVMISCPEHEVFDSRDFLRPILMPFEVELAFNSSRISYTQYCMDFRQILPGEMNYVDFEASTDSDVSLITGKLRTCDNNAPRTDNMNALAVNSTGSVAIGKAGAEFLHGRSWMGLDQSLGKTAVRSAEIGRSGLPNSYENEPVSTQKPKDLSQ